MKIISLDAARKAKKISRGDPEYQDQIVKMTKLELLEEMMRFQKGFEEDRPKNLSFLIQGRILFRALMHHAETPELRTLSRAFHQYLSSELESSLLSLSCSPQSARSGQPSPLKN